VDESSNESSSKPVISSPPSLPPSPPSLPQKLSHCLLRLVQVLGRGQEVDQSVGVALVGILGREGGREGLDDLCMPKCNKNSTLFLFSPPSFPPSLPPSFHTHLAEGLHQMLVRLLVLPLVDQGHAQAWREGGREGGREGEREGRV